ncbi:MAG: hypothetical protein ACR652_12300 [Methylocystis sp.]|uniref:hypothetical protein n=1 Tax=Methylocystis sp. TaxID=1911079 RepID=UPI003DA5A90D
MRASLKDLVVAIFNGAPSAEAAQAYSAQATALISLYICFVAVFLIAIYIRATKRNAALPAAVQLFRVWIAAALMMAVVMIAAVVTWFYLSL